MSGRSKKMGRAQRGAIGTETDCPRQIKRSEDLHNSGTEPSETAWDWAAFVYRILNGHEANKYIMDLEPPIPADRINI